MRAILLTTLLLLAACAPIQVGRSFDPDPFLERVQRGQTTSQQVLTWLGPPQSRGEIIDADGRQFIRWLYYYGQGKPPKFADLSFRILEIHFDAEGRVAAYNWTGEKSE